MTEDMKTKVENCKECGSHNTFSDDPDSELCQKCFSNDKSLDGE